MTVHDFQAQLDFSHGAAGEPEWCAAYRKIWPDLTSIVDMRHNGPHQKQGIDRMVFLSNGRVMTIDEKVRRAHWNDLLVEIWSVYENQVPGWTIDPQKKCSHIAYLFLSSRLCVLLPFDELRRATLANRARWEALADSESEGFRWVKATNERDNGSVYTTWCLAIPNTEVQHALLSAMVVRWDQ